MQPAECFLTEWMEPTHQRLMDGSARGTSRSRWSVSQRTSLSYDTNTPQCKYKYKYKYSTDTYTIDGSAWETSRSGWSVSQRTSLTIQIHYKYVANILQIQIQKRWNTQKYITNANTTYGCARETSWSRWSVSQRLYLTSPSAFLGQNRPSHNQPTQYFCLI